MRVFRSFVMAGAAFGLAASWAQAQPADAARPVSGHASVMTSAVNEGVVRRIDKEQGKVTLKHGPIPSLDMPGMTMVFKVADPKLLEGLREGDSVRFAADRVNGSILVTALQPVK